MGRTVILVLAAAGLMMVGGCGDIERPEDTGTFVPPDFILNDNFPDPPPPTPEPEPLPPIEISFVADDNGDVAGVDDATGFSKDDATVILPAITLTLLDQTAFIEAVGSNECNIPTLSHRGTRGVGVSTGETDEVDAGEQLLVHFDTAQSIELVELRSLFTGEQSPGTEEGDLDFYLDGTLVATVHVTGEDDLNDDDAVGLVTLDYTEDPIEADTIAFSVAEGEAYSDISEFALARILVTNAEESGGDI